MKDEEDCSTGREEHKLGTFCDLGRVREDSILGECPCVEFEEEQEQEEKEQGDGD